MTMQMETIITRRECTGLQVPIGNTVTIPKGSMVNITQALGNSFSINYQGNLIRIDGKDADALGKESEILQFAADPNGNINEEDIWATLKTCYDPEIPVNIVDLGLIYSCAINNTDKSIAIQMTLTAPGCGMGDVLAKEIEHKLQQIPHVQKVHIDLVFDPPWDRDRLSDVAKLQLGLY